ncbi:hypothetical protein ABIF57_007809 [Bradyrhizobium diazoefficiens]
MKPTPSPPTANATPAMTDDTIPPFSFPAIHAKKVTAAFDGGRLTSNGGVMLLAMAERRLGLADNLARVFPDRRDPTRVVHSLVDMKEELGLDHFEGRSWQGLHRHALMTMIAYAFLQHRRLAYAGRKKRINGPPPQPTMPAARHAIVDLILRPPPQQCPYCRKQILEKQWRKRILFAVGTPITGRPPRRSRRAQLRHRAPTSGV